MSVAVDFRVDVMLKGYARTILEREGLVGYWRLGESSGVSAVDASGNGNTGTYTNSPTLGAVGAIADGDTAVSFDGVDDYVAVTSLPAMSQITIEGWIYSTSIGTDQIWFSASSIDYVRVVASHAFVSLNVGGVQKSNSSPTVLVANTWYHISVTFDGTDIKLYVNGSLDLTINAPGVLTTWASAVNANIGRYASAADHYFVGRLDEVAIYSRALTAEEVAESHRLRLIEEWTDITADVELDGGLHFHRGINGSGPTDVVAEAGTLSFTLDNSDRNEGGLRGWYSPHHENCRDGWAFDIACKLTFISGSPERVHLRGRIRVINPEPGIYLAQRVRVEAYDLMRYLDETNIREIDIATDITEAEVIDAVLDLLPDELQPDSRDLDAGVDTFPYVFNKIGPDSRMTGPIADATISSFGLFAIKGDGTPMFRNRSSRQQAESAYTFTEIRNVQIPSSLDGVYRVVGTTVHPTTIDPSPTSVLYGIENVPLITSGDTLSFFGDYRDTIDDRSLIGGLERQVPLTPTTDYLANSQEDGLGTDETANVSIVVSDFAASAKFEITNNGLNPVYLTFLQIRGKRVLDIGAQRLQSGMATQRIRPIEIDMPLQSNPAIGQAAADYVRLQYSEDRQQIQGIEFLANYSEELLDQFMTREICDCITVTEEQTGTEGVDAIIMSIEAELFDAGTVICRYGLAPANPIEGWTLDESELDVSAVLAF